MASSTEESKLNEQHGFITSSLGFHIHPTIAKALLEEARIPPEDIRIADISRGDQFAKNEEILPATLHAAKRTRVPFEGFVAINRMQHDSLRGKFHIVAVRLLHTNVVPNRFAEVLEDLIALLRPGGWLQWIDWDPMTARIASVRPGTDDGVIREILGRFTEALRTRKAGSTYKISSAMGAAAAGLEAEDSDMYTVTPEVRFTKVVVASALLYLERSDSCTAEEASELRAKVRAEIEGSGALLFYDLWCHIARKPMEC